MAGNPGAGDRSPMRKNSPAPARDRVRAVPQDDPQQGPGQTTVPQRERNVPRKVIPADQSTDQPVPRAVTSGKVTPSGQSASQAVTSVPESPVGPLDPGPDEKGNATVAVPTGRTLGVIGKVRPRVPWLFRRGWALVMVTLLVTLTAVGASGLKSATYSSDAILLVNPGATNTSPGSSQEAQALAATYAGLIPTDNAVLTAVSRATGLTEAQVKSGTTVTVVNGTSLLDLRFSSPRASTTTVGVTAMSNAISGEHPVTAAIPAGTMAVIHGASTPLGHAQKPIEVVILGILIGLILGTVIVVVWERADARFDRPGQVTGQLGIPTRSLQQLNADSAMAMVDRWRSLAIIDEPTIALLSAVTGMQATTTVVGRELASLAPGVHLRTGGSPGDENGDRVAQFANLTVLVIPREARVRAVLRSVDFLSQVGIRPAWALMVDEDLH